MMRLFSMKGLQILGLALLWIQQASSQSNVTTVTNNTTATTTTTDSETTTTTTTTTTNTNQNVCRVCGNRREIANETKMVSTSFGIFTCSSLEVAGLYGNILPENCDAAKAAAMEKCGCTFVNGTTTNSTTIVPNCTTICPNGGIVTNSDGIVVIPGSSKSLTCRDHLTLAISGDMSRGQCKNIRRYTNITCGCTKSQNLTDIDITRPSNTNETFVCPVCGEGMVSSTPNKQVTLPSRTARTCREFEEAASLGRISRQQCGLLKSYVEASCQCVVGTPIAAPTPAPSQVYDCPICGEDMIVTKLDGTVIIPTQPDRTCRNLLRANRLGKINRQQCGLLQPFVKEYCGCIPTSLTAIPTKRPTVSPTMSPTMEDSPTSSPAPTGWIVQKDGCFDNLMEIYQLEKALEDPSENRRYILCPDTTFHLGELRDDGQIINGDAFLMLRPNVMYQCGEDGFRRNNCILKGGDFGLLSLYGVYEGIFETVHNVRIRGITFESQNLFGAVMEAAGDIQFIACAFKNHGNMAPVLIQWRGNGPSSQTSDARERQLRVSKGTDSALAQFKRRILNTSPNGQDSHRRHLQDQVRDFSHTVTFRACVFRGNHVGPKNGFPGVIENSFRSELIIQDSIFQDNIFGKDQENPAPTSYAIRSHGPINVESSCFMDNSFLLHGPVQVFGARHTMLGNYVRSSQPDLSCEFLAVFSSRDDTTDATPVCFDSDATSCPVEESPTSSPTDGPPTTPPSVAPIPESTMNTEATVETTTRTSSLSRSVSVSVSVLVLTIVTMSLGSVMIHVV